MELNDKVAGSSRICAGGYVQYPRTGNELQDVFVEYNEARIKFISAKLKFNQALAVFSHHK